ncbi:MAG: hypothetical protein ACI4OA_07690 [Selenomonadaceae bacterium]
MPEDKKDSESSANRKYKDRLFVDLFSDKENALSLFNAANDTNYTDIDNLEIVTLKDVLYLTMKNDLALLFHDCINLIEQQSTINPNMPLRGFIYAAKEYTEWLSKNEIDIYGTRLVKIPAPKYFVLCNANKEMPESWDEKLSKAFAHEAEGYEWTAHVLNINAGHSKKIMSRCEPLEGYATLIKKIRDHQAQGETLEKAIISAVNECIDEGVLKQYLLANKSGVTDMILTEYNEELHDRTMKDEGRAEGRAEGRVEGLAKGRAEGRAEGRIEGRVNAIVDNIRSLMKSAKWSRDEAMNALQIPQDERKTIAALI